MQEGLELSDPGLEVEDITGAALAPTKVFARETVAKRIEEGRRISTITHLRGISLLVIGSYPMQATFAFSQLRQLGSFWSHLFFLRRQRLQALTLRKLLLWPTLPVAGPAGPPPPAAAASPAASCLAPGPERLIKSCGSLVAGEGSALAELTEGGESLSGDAARRRLAGCMCGEGAECGDIVFLYMCVCVCGAAVVSG